MPLFTCRLESNMNKEEKTRNKKGIDKDIEWKQRTGKQQEKKISNNNKEKKIDWVKMDEKLGEKYTK